MGFLNDIFGGIGDVFSSVTEAAGKLPTGTVPAAITSGAALTAGLLGSDDDLARLQLEENKRQFDLTQELKERELALAAAQGSGNSGAALAAAKLAADTQRKIAASRLAFDKQQAALAQRQYIMSELLKASEGRPELLQQARQNQIQAVQNTGNTGLNAFNALAGTLQGPIRRG